MIVLDKVRKERGGERRGGRTHSYLFLPFSLPCLFCFVCSALFFLWCVVVCWLCVVVLLCVLNLYNRSV